MANSQKLIPKTFADFGYREQKEAQDLFEAWKLGLPVDFENNGVRVAFNMNSGYVFLNNSLNIKLLCVRQMSKTNLNCILFIHHLTRAKRFI